MEHIAQKGVIMLYIFGAEEYNWLIELEGVISVTMTDKKIVVLFDTNDNALAAWKALDDYEIFGSARIDNVITLT